MRLGDMNNITAEKLNEDMAARVGWNFGDLTRLTVAQASAMLETVDNKLAVYKTSSKLHESEKSATYNGLMLAKQVLETFMSEVDNPYAVGMAQAMKSTGDKPPLKKSTIKKAHKIAKAVAKESVEVNEAGYTAAERQVDQTFNTVMDRLLAMAKVMREDGALAVNIEGIGGDASYLRDAYKGILSAYDDVEEAHYGAMGHLHMDESAAQGVMEDEVGQAESLMAAQDMVDRIQGMLEDVGEMINEELPPLTDSLRRSNGADAAAAFNQQTSGALNALMDAVRSAREAMAGAVGTLTGDEQPMPMDSAAMDTTDDGMDFDAELDTDDEVDLDDFEASDAATGGDEPLGRAKRA